MLAGAADYSQTHAARPDDPPFRQTTWRRANPSTPYMTGLLAAYRRESLNVAREGDAPPRGHVIFAVDLGDVASLSAVTAYWPTPGRLEVMASVPRDRRSLEPAVHDLRDFRGAALAGRVLPRP